MAGYLIERTAETSVIRHMLVADVTTIGRDQTNDIVLETTATSRHHARVCWDGRQYVVEDIESRNGTYLNRHKLDVPQPLHHGDVLLIGGRTLSFESDETTDWVPESVAPDALRLDLASAQVWVGEREVRLTSLEYRALALLHRQRGALVRREALVKHLWPEYQGGVSDDTVAQVLSRLRRKLGDTSDEPRYLYTVRGHGYRLASA